jgi:hypothetical protein
MLKKLGWILYETPLCIRRAHARLPGFTGENHEASLFFSVSESSDHQPPRPLEKQSSALKP